MVVVNEPEEVLEKHVRLVQVKLDNALRETVKG